MSIGSFDAILAVMTRMYRADPTVGLDEVIAAVERELGGEVDDTLRTRMFESIKTIRDKQARRIARLTCIVIAGVSTIGLLLSGGHLLVKFTSGGVYYHAGEFIIVAACAGGVWSGLRQLASGK